MPLLIPREKEFWQRKPTERRDLNYSNQFADSLVACVVTDEVDLVSGIKYKNRVDYGEYIHFEDVGYNAELDTQAGTLIADVREDTLVASWERMGYGYDLSATNRQNISFSKRIDPIWRGIIASHDVGGSSNEDYVPSVEKGIICISYDSNDVTANAVRYHRDSRLILAKAWLGLPLTTDTRKRIKCEGTHAVKFFYMLNRALDDDEAKCLSDAPYQVLTKKKTIFLLPATTPIITLNDTGIGADALNSPQVSLGIGDTGSGMDLAPGASAGLNLADAGAASESVSPAISLQLSDLGSVSELLGATASLAIADSAAGTDTVQALTVSLSLLDTGAGTDALSVSVQVPLIDNGTGLDALAIQSLLAIVDAAGGVDAVVRFDAGQQVATITFSMAQRRIQFTLH